jgi:DtxR family Mn-dependent transcriptional regulator
MSDLHDRRHRLAERLLRDVVGLDWWRIHHEAAGWDEVISDEVERRLVELLGDPGTCPHGNPIPGSANAPDQSSSVPLADAAVGTCRIVRITEELEEDDAALRALEGAGIVPGRMAEILGHEADGTVKVVGAVADLVVPPQVAAGTWVEPVGD